MWVGDRVYHSDAPTWDFQKELFRGAAWHGSWVLLAQVAAEAVRFLACQWCRSLQTRQRLCYSEVSDGSSSFTRHVQLCGSRCYSLNLSLEHWFWILAVQVGITWEDFFFPNTDACLLPLQSLVCCMRCKMGISSQVILMCNHVWEPMTPGLCLFPSSSDLINPFLIKIAKINSAAQSLTDMVGKVGTNPESRCKTPMESGNVRNV